MAGEETQAGLDRDDLADTCAVLTDTRADRHAEESDLYSEERLARVREVGQTMVRYQADFRARLALVAES